MVRLPDCPNRLRWSLVRICSEMTGSMQCVSVPKKLYSKILMKYHKFSNEPDYISDNRCILMII